MVKGVMDEGKTQNKQENSRAVSRIELLEIDNRQTNW
jgi:hypothetical protein